MSLSTIPVLRNRNRIIKRILCFDLSKEAAYFFVSLFFRVPISQRSRMCIFVNICHVDANSWLQTAILCKLYKYLILAIEFITTFSTKTKDLFNFRDIKLDKNFNKSYGIAGSDEDNVYVKIYILDGTVTIFAPEH